MSKLRLVSNLLDKFSIFLLFAIMLVMAFCLITLIFGRNLFNTSFSSLEEYSRFALIWMTFIGATVAYKYKEHMGVEFFVGKFFKGKVLTCINFLKDSVILLLLGALIYYGWELVMFNTEIKSLQARIPMAYPYFVLPLSGFIMFVHTIDHMAHSYISSKKMKKSKLSRLFIKNRFRECD